MLFSVLVFFICSYVFWFKCFLSVLMVFWSFCNHPQVIDCPLTLIFFMVYLWSEYVLLGDFFFLFFYIILSCFTPVWCMHFLFAALYMHICVLLCARLCVFKLKKIILSIPCVSYAQLNICLLSRLFIVAALEKTPSSSMLSLNFFILRSTVIQKLYHILTYGYESTEAQLLALWCL